MMVFRSWAVIGVLCLSLTVSCTKDDNNSPASNGDDSTSDTESDFDPDDTHTDSNADGNQDTDEGASSTGTEGDETATNDDNSGQVDERNYDRDDDSGQADESDSDRNDESEEESDNGVESDSERDSETSDEDSEASTSNEDTGSDSAQPCYAEGDQRTTFVFTNRCSEAITVEGSHISAQTVMPGDSHCSDLGSDVEEIPSIRYWGYVGSDPGPERHTLAEFTLNTDFNDFDWYNISHVDAHNLPMSITPIGRSDCPLLSCPDELLSDCPEEGQHIVDGDIVSCVSPDRNNPDSVVAQYFDAACSDAYSWSGDDAESMAACAGEDFEIAFCPAGTKSLSNNAKGGTITFLNVGAKGEWPRRLDKPAGDPACSYKDGTDTWGGHCCMEMHATESDRISPFDEEMTLIMKAIHVKQLAVYQPQSDESSASWEVVSYWDPQAGDTNFTFTKSGDDDAAFDGDLTRDDCVWYLMQEPIFDCDTFDAYYCPDDPGINHLGWEGSKLIIFKASMSFDDSGVSSCDGGGEGHPGPWVAFVASELIRDGGRKWNGLCNCYTKTDHVGDGCGEINVFEVVMDNNEYSNREFISTGLRTFQVGHAGGNVCGSGCDRNDFSDDVEVLDACANEAYTTGPEVVLGGDSDGCPVWKRPEGDRYFMILLDESTRTIQVAIMHPDDLPQSASDLLPDMNNVVSRQIIDQLIDMRLPAGN